MNKSNFGKNESLWVATSPKTKLQSLKKNLDVDFLVIGAGITGLHTALFLALKKKKVVVIDANRIIKGTSGYTTAKITSAHGLIYDFLIRNYGLDNAKIYAQSNQWAIDKIKSIVSEYNIDCNFENLNAYNYAQSSEETKNLEKEFLAAKKLGLPVSFEKNPNLPFKVTSRICYSGQAQFHPRKYLLKLMEIIESLGGKIFENTPALDIIEGDNTLVKTPEAQISAKNVIITTNNQFANYELFSKLIFPYQSYIACFKVSKKPFEGTFYSREDGAYSLRNYTLSRQNYLLVGGEGHLAQGLVNKDEKIAKLVKYAKKHFKADAPVYNWQAEDNVPVDRLPLIGKFTPKSKNVYLATGFNAWGMTKGIMAGKILSDLVMGVENDWAKLYDPWSKLRINHRANIEKKLAEPLDDDHYIKEFISNQKGEKMQELKNDEGKIITEDGKPIAYYKDESGKLNKISPVCKHMGCIVGWNDKEKTWDCPCHGSRYDKLGHVIHGPSKKDLDKLS